MSALRLVIRKLLYVRSTLLLFHCPYADNGGSGLVRWDQTSRCTSCFKSALWRYVSDSDSIYVPNNMYMRYHMQGSKCFHCLLYGHNDDNGICSFTEAECVTQLALAAAKFTCI